MIVPAKLIFILRIYKSAEKQSGKAVYGKNWLFLSDRIDVMPVILNIETSTEVCSVALTCDGQVVFNRENYKGLSHASSLGGYVQEALGAARESHLTLDAVAVSRGPGSYTGLRIGVSEAKGLCFGLDVPLIAVDTLAVMACAVMFKKTIDEEALLCPMIDARRMEVYSAVYDRALQAVKPVSAEIVTETSYADILQEKPVLFFGNHACECPLYR